MAGLIEIDDDHAWSSSNWVFWGILDHVLAANAGSDREFLQRVELCKHMQAVLFPFLRQEDAALAERVWTALKIVVQRCADGDLPCSVDGRLLDDQSQKQFRGAAAELAQMMK